MATWGAASASTLQEVETLMATLEKKLDKMYSCVTASPAAAPLLAAPLYNVERQLC